MVYVISTGTYTDCSAVAIEGKEWFDDMTSAPFRFIGKSVPYEPPTTPIRLKLSKVKIAPQGPPDALADAFVFFCSQAFKDLVESLEPGLHDFVACTALYRKTEYPFYIVRPQIHDVIDVEASTKIGKITWVHHEDEEPFWSKMPVNPVVVAPELVAGRHLWQQRTQFGLNPINFISDELHDAILDQSLIHCWKFQKQMIGEPATV